METRDCFGNTPLHRVIVDKKLTQNEMIESLKRLLGKKIKINAENSDGQTALHLAILNRMRDVADFLIGRKANFGKISHFFIDDEYRKFRELLKQNRCFSSLYPPHQIQQMEIESASFVEWLISKGLDFDCKNEKNESAVYKAIDYGLQHILPALLKSVKDISFVDNEKRTALQQFFYRNTEILRGHFNIFWAWYSQRYALDIVTILLDRGIQVEAEDMDGHTHIDTALITMQKGSVIEMLVERCTFIRNNRKPTGIDILNLMIRKHDLSKWKTEDFLRTLRCMITKGMDFNKLRKIDYHDKTLMCYAIEKQNMLIIDFLREFGIEDFNVRMKNGQTLLHLFAGSHCRNIDNNKEIELLDLLVSKGCLVNAKDDRGKTPLHEAVQREKVEIIQKLIEYGAEVNCRTNNGITALQMAVDRIKNFHVIELLGKSGADFNVTTKDGENFLHLLSRNRDRRDGNLELFNLLIQKGCQVNAKDFKGITPLHLAIKSYNEGIARKLIEHGAEVNCMAEDGTTPLLLAAKRHYYSLNLVDLLLKKEADPTVITQNNENLLHLLASGRNDKTNTVTAHFNLFIEKGCQINAKNIRGMTPLHEAALSENFIVAQKLIEHGADINCRNNKKETPLHLAVEISCNDDIDIIELILEYEINVNAQDFEGQTAFHKAAVKFRNFPYYNESILWTLLAEGADVNVQDINARSAFRCAFDRNPDEESVNYPGRSRCSSESSDDFEKEKYCNKEMWVAEKYACNEAIFLMDHSIKLKSAMLPWDTEINSLLENPNKIEGDDCTREEYYRECLEEIETLKTNFVDDHISLYDLLHTDLNRRRIYLNKKKWQELVHSENLQEQFPKYSVLILANHCEAVTRKSLLEPAKISLKELTKMNWPDLCSEFIFSFLNNSDLFNILERD